MGVKRNAYRRTLVAQADRIILLGRTRYTWEDNIKIDHTRNRMVVHELDLSGSG
jgi:hypothetical protein